eukprot:COSAG06_NODE_46526_length_346_cov_0.821862_1_plen_41_part_01
MSCARQRYTQSLGPSPALVQHAQQLVVLLLLALLVKVSAHR